MNKKIFMSVAAAATIATTFTGCGSSDSSSAGTTATGTSVLVPADGYIYGATATCTNGTASVSTDDNKTITISSSSPGVCTITGGAHLIGGAYVDSNATLTAIVPADSNGTVNVTPITTMVAAFAGANPTAASLTLAKKKTLSALGIDPSLVTDIDKAINADPTDLGASSDQFTKESRSKIVEIFTAMDQMKTAGVPASAITTALSKIVEAGSSTAASAVTTAGIISKFNDAITLAGSDVNTTVTGNIQNAMSSINAKFTAAGSLDEVESIADAAIKAVAAQKAAINSGATFTTGAMDTAFTAANSTIQGNLNAVYIDHVSGVKRLTLGGSAADINASYDYNGTINGFPVAQFKLADRNISDANYTADISALFQNEGNANYSFKVMFKAVPVDGTTTGGSYLFKMANNTNVSYAGKGFDGVADSYKTVDANATSGGDTNGTLVGALGTGTTTDMNLSQVATWTYEKLVTSGSGTYSNANTTLLTNYGVNSNWSTKIILNMNDNGSAVTLYKKQADGNLSAASTDSITVETQKTGAVIFNGRFY